jgi:Icc-related predicted phosphoesterase
MSSPLVPPRRRNTNNSIRIIAFSDWRVQDYEDLLKLIERIPDCDIILYGGDDLDRLIDARDVVKQIAERTSAERLLFVAGNDDTPEDRQSLMEEDFAHNLHEEPFVYKDFAFLGLEGTTDGMGFIHHTEAEVNETLDKQLKSLKKRKTGKKLTKVIVSHAPPHNVLDIAMRHAKFFGREGARSIGSTSLRYFLDKNWVPLTICGHVHLCGGRQEALPNKNLVINIASHDDPSAEGKIAVIELRRTGQAEVSFHSTRLLLYEHELGRLRHVAVKRVRQLLQNGIKSLADVTEGNRDKLRIPSCGERHINIWIRQAEMFRSGISGIEIIAPERMAFLRESHYVVWDIETDLDQKHIWLIGALDTKTGEKIQFFDPDDEKACIKGFINWMEKRRTATPISFSSTRLDARALENSLSKYGLTDTANVCKRDIDLCSKMQYNCAHTYPSTKVKELAYHLGYKFKHPDIDGMSVGIMFTRYLRTGRAPDKWEPYLEYNEDDVAATLLVLNKLKEIDALLQNGTDARMRTSPRRKRSLQ